MRKGTPNQFMKELEDKIANLKGVESAAQIIDDGEVVIEADADISENPGVSVEETPEVLKETEDDHEAYYNELYTRVEEELQDAVEGVAWTSDSENVYMDVNFTDGHIFTFTIPRSDLVLDADTDVQYICKAVRGSQGEENDQFDDLTEGLSSEDIYEEYDIPAYL